MTDTPYLLPIKETIKSSWNKVSGTKTTICISFIFTIAFMSCLLILNLMVLGIMPKVILVTGGAIQVFCFLLQMGLVYMGIKRAQDEPISFNLLFRAFDGSIAFKLICLYILQALIILIPTIALMVLGFVMEAIAHIIGLYKLPIVVSIISAIVLLYVAIRISLAFAFILDKEVGPIEALKLSFHATQSNFWRLVGIFLIQTLIVMVSLIPLGIGLIWTLPFACINIGMVYKNLSQNNLSN